METLYTARWQVGDGKPTDYEIKLGDALEAAFAAGHHELYALVAALNAAGVPAPDGHPWTEERFTAAMKQLGA